MCCITAHQNLFDSTFFFIFPSSENVHLDWFNTDSNWSFHISRICQIFLGIFDVMIWKQSICLHEESTIPSPLISGWPHRTVDCSVQRIAFSAGSNSVKSNNHIDRYSSKWPLAVFYIFFLSPNTADNWIRFVTRNYTYTWLIQVRPHSQFFGAVPLALQRHACMQRGPYQSCDRSAL